MAGWCEISKNDKDPFHFVLRVDNEQALLDQRTGKTEGN